MKYIKNISWLLFVTILFQGCVTQKNCSKRFPCLKETDTTHSSVVTVLRHDTIFKFQADSSALQALIECEGNIPRLKQIIAYTQGKRVEIPIIRMKHDTMFIECRVDSGQVARTWFEKHTTEYTKIKNQAVQIEFRQTSFQSFLMWAGIIAMGIIVIFIIIRFGIPLIKKAIL